MSYELGLFGLAVLFYLYDSTVLLYSNEAILVCDAPGQWHAATGMAGFLLAGRTPCLLNPFTPHRPSFRLSWDFNSLESHGLTSQWMERTQELRALAPSTLSAAIGLFVLLPIGMFTALGAYAIIPALVLLYGSILVSLIIVARRSLLVTPGWRRWLVLAFECLACPPFGVNLVRRTTLGHRIAEPLPLAAARLLDAAAWAGLRAFCVARLTDALQLTGADSLEQKSLEAQRQRLLELGGGR